MPIFNRVYKSEFWSYDPTNGTIELQIERRCFSIKQLSKSDFQNWSYDVSKLFRGISKILRKSYLTLFFVTTYKYFHITSVRCMSSHIIKYSAKILNQKDHRHQKLCHYVIFLSNFMAFLSTFCQLSAITFDPEGVTNK